MSWFRVVGTLSAACYSIYIFPYSSTHSTAIFLGAAALYLTGFGLMCLNVREGSYPPPPPCVGGGTGPVAMVKSYGKECHSHRIYWYLWLCTFLGAIGNGIVLFDLYFKLAIGLNMTQIGSIGGAALVVVSILVLGAGWLADRYHPIRVVLASQIIGWVTLIPATMIWIFWHPGAGAVWTFHLPILQYVPFMQQFAVFQIQQVFLISVAIYVGLAAPLAALGAMWDPVMIMRIFPRSHYGQFCSTNAVWRSVGGMIGGVMAGAYFDILTPWVGKERTYFYGPLWAASFGIPAFILFLKFYRSWKRLGGDESYVPPMIEAAVEMRVAPGVATVAASAKTPL